MPKVSNVGILHREWSNPLVEIDLLKEWIVLPCMMLVPGIRAQVKEAWLPKGALFDEDLVTVHVLQEVGCCQSDQ